MGNRRNAFQSVVVYTTCLVVAVCLLYVELSKADEVQCKGKPMHMNVTQKKDMKDCLNKFGVKSIYKLESSNIPCFGQCMFTVRGFISQDGESIVMDRFMEYLETVIPEAGAKTELKKTITSCIMEHGEKIKKDDTSCMSFMEIMSCVKDGFFDVCIAED